MPNNILLVGNPNTGKSTLFNQLTGLRQKTANFEGVTVEKKKGKFGNHNIIDLPGLKSLWSVTLDEEVSAREIIHNKKPDQSPVLFIASGLNLEENLLLFSQIADLQVPMALVLNYKDEVTKNKIQINLTDLKSKLGCPVFLVNSRSGEGVDLVRALIKSDGFKIPSAFARSYYDKVSDKGFENNYRPKLMQWVDSDNSVIKGDAIQDLEKRHLIIHNILQDTVRQPKELQQVSRGEKLDKVFLHPLWGTLIFLVILFLVFQAIFTFATYPMDWIDGFFGNLANWAVSTIQPTWLGDLIGNGIIKGLGGILIFIPQIAILFFLFGILESTGYMSRISFLSDNLLKRFGLSGSAVVPLVSGLACSIPAIMSARAINNEQERLAIILATPFMTCSARLPVYAILIALIFPEDTFLGIFNIKGLALFGMYMLGTLMSLLAAWIVIKFKSSDKKSMWILELPLYRRPHWKRVFQDMYLKTKSFVVDAGKVILLFSIILWFLSSFSPHSESYLQEKITENITNKIPEESAAEIESSTNLQYSYSGYIGKFIEPAIAPLGYDWKIGIALFSSFAAREIFVGTLSTLYSVGSEEESTIIGRLKAERIPGTTSPRFTIATCISLLLFYAFALQCMSTVAIVRRETGSWKWPAIQFTAMLIIAYLAALAAFQLLN